MEKLTECVNPAERVKAWFTIWFHGKSLLCKYNIIELKKIKSSSTFDILRIISFLFYDPVVTQSYNINFYG